MALFNYATKEITLKIVYYGPGLSGKTTNIQHLHSALNADNKGKLLSLSTESDRTLFFDFLPVELGKIREFSIRFQLYTVPGQVRYNATRKVVLKGADAVVFVADSQRDMKYQNLESFENMRENLVANNLNPDQIPLVLQYNKRDLKNILSVSELNEDLNPNGSFPVVEAEAVKGIGVEDSFQLITRLVLKYISRKHKIEIQPAAMKAEEKLEEQIPEVQPLRKEPVQPATKPAGMAFKEALKGISDTNPKHKKEQTGIFSFPEKDIPELKQKPVKIHPDDSAVKAGDYEFDEALNMLDGENLDFNHEDMDIPLYQSPESGQRSESGTEAEVQAETEVTQAYSEADLLESTAYESAAELPDEAGFEIKEKLKESFPESKPEFARKHGMEDPIESKAVLPDPEAELIESTVYDIDESLELINHKSPDFKVKTENISAESKPETDMISLKNAFEAERERGTHQTSSFAEIRDSRSVVISDEGFRLISADILALNNLLSDISGSVSSLRNEMKSLKESLNTANEKAASRENLDEIRKEQREMSGRLRDIVSLFDKLKTRKSWFRF